ncbi:MAG: hypothetical protein JXR41_05035 [Bacteroidales bacterium]|nr:hypothetical protein [Bacteroidales bacterium]MBN2762436.1 hypothetical protein [Bacteroidales bacterium]
MNIELYHSDFLNFVELNYTGDNDEYRRCDPESKYLDTVVFNLFLECFENANKVFDYFSGTKYNSRKIIVLRNELITNLEGLDKIGTLKEFERMVEDRFMGKDFLQELNDQKSGWRDNWKESLDKLKTVNRELITLTEKCADEERILWVIGY